MHTKAKKMVRAPINKKSNLKIMLKHRCLKFPLIYLKKLGRVCMDLPHILPLNHKYSKYSMENTFFMLVCSHKLLNDVFMVIEASKQTN